MSTERRHGDHPCRPGRSLRRGLGSVTLVLVVLPFALVGCGQDESPAEAAPALPAALAQVDDAIEAENYARARSAIEFLLAQTRRAEQDGDLPAEDADRIRTAARDLLNRLPGNQPEPAPQDSAPEGEGTEPDDEEERQKKDEPDRDDEKPGKEKGKEKEKDDEGKGNGPSSENGPDDGEGE